MSRRAWACALAGVAVALGAPLLHSQSVPDAALDVSDAGDVEGAPDAPAPEPAPEAPRRPYDHVVIVSFDGMRPDGMERALAPTLHRLRAEGASALQATTISDSSTLPSHSSMLSGVEERVHGMNFDDFHADREFIRVPTVFYRAHDAGLATAMFSSKMKLRHIAVPGSVDVWSLPHWSCDRVAREASRYLATSPPGVTFMLFEEPDDAGHRRRWMSARYLDAIARADRCFADVMAAIESRPDRDRVLVIATADHGGHGRHHGTRDPQDLHIPWVAWGSRVVRGDFDDPVRTTDTAATTLAALGIEVPRELTGRAVRRAIDGEAPPAEPAPDAGAVDDVRDSDAAVDARDAAD